MAKRKLADGALRVFPLPNGMFGACRVLRGPDADETAHAEERIVATTSATARDTELGAPLRTRRSTRSSSATACC
jgi:hypothetical protein